ncbi:MAG: SDR family NAD(P)-dependent oxidoreductase [Burkholderiaceae bacterium]
MSTEKKVVLLAGAAHGIGRAAALELIGRGVALAVCDIDQAGLDSLRAELPADSEVLLQHADVTSMESLRAFGCRIIACDTADRSAFYARHGITAVGFDELVERSEVLSLHIPLTPQTAGLYGTSTLARLRSDCVLINTARGGIVDEAALYERLQTGAMAAACADVFEAEPAFSSPLLKLPNFFGTPHIGGSAAEARLAMGRIAIEGLFDNFVPTPGAHPFDSSTSPCSPPTSATAHASA